MPSSSLRALTSVTAIGEDSAFSDAGAGPAASDGFGLAPARPRRDGADAGFMFGELEPAVSGGKFSASARASRRAGLRVRTVFLTIATVGLWNTTAIWQEAAAT
jgi:hypothetical protein